jgi:hypothetical protein
MIRGLALGVLLGAALVSTAGCTPDPAVNGPVPEGDTVVGRVAVVGSAPMNVRVALYPDEGPAVYLVGPLETEMRQLGGLRVSVTGHVRGRELHAAAYDVVSADGRPAVMGVVERGPGDTVRLRLRDGSAVTLTGATANLPTGARVWVQGPEQVQVHTYGIISPSP